MEVVHFGCWPGHGAGHFFHDTTGKTLGLYANEVGLPWEQVDGRLTPGRRDSRGQHTYEAMSQPMQGRAALHHLDGWTALAIHDFTIDSRPGSNTVLFFHALLDKEQALAAAHEHFPIVMRCIGQVTIVLAPSGSRDGAS